MRRCLLTALAVLLSLIILANSQFTLLAYGDIGEFEEFSDSRGTTDSDGSVFKLDEAKGTCSRLSGSWKGFEEFQKLVNKDINSVNKFNCNADSVVILGDLIYPEVKHRTDKTLRAIKILKSEARYAGWRARVVCAFFVLKNVLNSIKCPANTKNPLSNRNANGLFARLNLIFGNHSFDVDYRVESDYIIKLTAYKGYVFKTATAPKDLAAAETQVTSQEFQDYPVMQTRIQGNTRVEFLDWNLMASYCYVFDNPLHTEEQFNKCFLLTQYGAFFSYQQSKKYTEMLILAIKSFTPTANWRVMRSHHPVMNIDGFPADNSWFWVIPIDNAGNTLMDLLKQYKVNILLASHHHSSQLSAFPWSQNTLMKTTYAYKTMKATHTIGLRKKVITLSGVTCLDTCPADAPKCMLNDFFTNQQTNSTYCFDTKKTMNFKHNTADPGNLLIIVQGGSGRELDPLQSDQKTPAALLFGRATAHGGVQMIFNPKSLTAKFFEGEKVVFSFNTIDEQKDNYPVIENYVKAKLEGALISKTKADTMLSFDFKKYVDTKDTASKPASSLASFIQFSFITLILSIIAIF